MSEQILSGVRVVELASGLAGPVACQLLAESGAEVIKVEPPTGDPLRESAAFATWNRGKRSVVLDLTTAADRDRFDRLLAGADVLVHGLRPSRADSLGLGSEELRQRHPHLVSCSVLGYPTGHPDAERPGYDLLVQARSGLMDEQIGFRDGPVAHRFPGPSWGAALLAAAGVVARLIRRQQTGAGGAVHTSLLQGGLAIVSLFWNRASDPIPQLMSTKYDLGPHTAMYRCSDGRWLQIINPGGRRSLARIGFIRKVMAELGLEGEPTAKDMRDGFVRHPSERWMAELEAADMPCALVEPFGALLGSPLAEGLLVEVDDPVWGRVHQPGSPLRTQPPPVVRSPAPRLGADDALLNATPLSAAGDKNRAEEPGGPLLAGLRVLDLGAWVASPLASMLLGDLGAEVIKVEPIGGDPMHQLPGYFEACSRGKNSIALDLHHPVGRDVLARLLRWAQVAHHNLRPAAAARLGVDEESLRAHNPDLVFGHVSGYGSTGPHRERPGFDSVFQALAGWEVANAGTGNDPLFSRLCTIDVLSGLTSLVATLLAVYHHRRTGQPGKAEASLLALSAFTQSETMLLADGSLAETPTLDAGQHGVGPHYRIYQVRDGWIAVAALGSGAAERFRKVADVGSDTELETALRDRHSADLLAQLAAADVPAEAVREQHMHGFFDDPANVETGLAVSAPHAAFGTMEQPGAYWFFDDPRNEQRPTRAAPVPGQHSRQILTQLGYGPAAIEDMLASGAVAEQGQPQETP